MKISIVIPTRERAFYLRQSLKTALAINDPDLEIIVTDNESMDDTADVIAEVSDPRLHHVRTGRRVSMRQNYENGLNHATGDYILYFGDDDGIVPGQFKYLRRILESETPDALSWSFATYGWPSDDARAKTGTVRYEHRRAYGTPFRLDTNALSAAVRACRMEELDAMPAIYHGCMSRGFLERLRGPQGQVFGGSIPDIYMSYHSIFSGGRLLHAEHMFTVNAFSPASTGRAQFAYHSNDVRAEPGRRFIAEIEADPVRDVIETALSVRHVLFATLETVRAAFPAIAAPPPDYAAWYSYILGAVREDDHALRETLDRILSEYAARTQTVSALRTAPILTREYKPLVDRLHARLARLKDKVLDFRIPVNLDGANNILTAVTTTDRLLGQDYGAVLDGTKSRAAAWTALRRRRR